MVKSAENRMRSNLELLPVINAKRRPRYISALKKRRPRYISAQKFLKHCMSVKLADNFQIREHSWPCLFHIMQASASSLWYKMCTLGFLTNMAAHTDGYKKKKITHCKHVPYSTNEDLLNIKGKGDLEVLYPLSYVRYH